MEKIKVSQDALYSYLTEHDVKLSRLAELMGKTLPVVSSCFLHHKDMQGRPRYFTRQNVEVINQVLPQIAAELRSLLLTFGSDQVRTNSRGRTYDPALIEPLKAIGQYMNLTALVERVLGWNKHKKEAILVTPSNKTYGNISEADVLAINNELLSVAGVLSSYEVVPDSESSSSSE